MKSFYEAALFADPGNNLADDRGDGHGVSVRIRVQDFNGVLTGFSLAGR